MQDSLATARGKRLRDDAARSVRAAIAADAERALPEMRPVLAHLEANLFATGLNAAALAQLFQGPRSAFWPRFAELVVCSPRTYLLNHRLTVADTLVRTSRLSMRTIAELLGFGSKNVFSRLYSAWAGETAAERRSRSAGSPEARGAADRLEGVVSWRRTLAEPGGSPGPLGALELLGRLAGVDADLRLRDEANVALPRGEILFEAFKAARVWRVAGAEPIYDQASRVAYPIPLNVLLLHHHLSAEARKSPSQERAAHLRRLAAASLDACAGELRARLVATFATASMSIVELDLKAVSTRLSQVADAVVAIQSLFPTQP